MITFLTKNYMTIIVLAIIIAMVVLIIRKMVRDKKNGKSPCGCDCNNCGAYCPHAQKDKQ